MTVVSNASPLIILAKLQLFDLPLRLFGEVTISLEVWDEIVTKGAGLPGSTETRDAKQRVGWIHVIQLADSTQLAHWQSRFSLGTGEISTILLAKEISANITLMDDRQARLFAESEGVRVLGTVGLLELGYIRGELIDLRLTYQNLLVKGARVNLRILNESLASLNLQTL